MIEKCIISPRGMAKSIFLSLKEKRKNVCWITIANKDQISLVGGSSRHILSMHFDDVAVKAANSINTNQARKIKNFIYNHHINSKQSWVLLVNCNAGISRSGAIGDFVACKLNVGVINVICPFPNKLVMKLLGVSYFWNVSQWVTHRLDKSRVNAYLADCTQRKQRAGK